MKRDLGVGRDKEEMDFSVYTERWRRMGMPDSPPLKEQVTTIAILVVEDDIDIGVFVVHALEEDAHYRVLLARNGFEALEFVKTVRPQIFLLDHQLPGMNGLELYDQLQSREELKMTPVLFMSANPPVKELERRHLRYIRKPFELDDLLKMIKKLLAE
jgi:DNA-binding response OmpR family regulator